MTGPVAGLKRMYRRSRRWPVRSRIALVSAALTAVILIAFALVVGRLVSDRLHTDFENDLLANVSAYANGKLQVSYGPDGLRIDPAIGQLPLPNDAQVRIVAADGSVAAPSGASGFGAPRPGEVTSHGSLKVASALLAAPVLGTALYVEYARPESSVDATIGRLWLFLACGVAIGTLLAGIAGMAVANRAMRPIAALTAAAGEIATTRDPSRRIPRPESDDEVAELATTLDQMLRELDDARSETETTIRRQREFVADASHELRTPLTSILANLELLEGSLDSDDDDERAAVASALRSSKRMNRLVGDLLVLARADAGRLGRREECNLARIAGEAIDEVRPMADGHVLTSTLPASALVLGNPDELHRMILNLLENAIRHTPPETAIDLTLTTADGSAELRIADDGPGLPDGMEVQIFDRFVRGQGPADRASRNGTGTGLGLSIVRAVAESHGGAVVAANSSAGGAEFEVTLPLSAG
jgi:two-component system, OmpR family, sensor kinase